MCVCAPGSGTLCEADGSVGLQGHGAVEAPPAGQPGKCSLRSAGRHPDAAGAAGEQL